MSALTKAATAPPVHGLPCSVAVARDALDPDSRADFDAWMVGIIDMSDHQMWAGLQALGHRVGRQSVGRHRRGQCRCEQ